MPCKWNVWEKDGECSGACTGAKQWFIRTKKVTESGGGTCTGHNGDDRRGKDLDMKEEPCNPQDCPGKVRYIVNIVSK